MTITRSDIDDAMNGVGLAYVGQAADGAEPTAVFEAFDIDALAIAQASAEYARARFPAAEAAFEQGIDAAIDELASLFNLAFVIGLTCGRTVERAAQ